MEECSHQILKSRTAKPWELKSGSLRALQLLVALYLVWFCNVVIIDRNYNNATFDNRWLAGQHDGRLVTGKV